MGAHQSGFAKETVKRQIVWLPEANAELMEALEHYEAIRLGTGQTFRQRRC